MKMYKFVSVATVLLALVAVVLPAETGDDDEFGEGFGAGFSNDSEFDLPRYR